MGNHSTRARRRHGHLPGHIRDAFLSAAEAFRGTAPGECPPRVPFQVRYRDRTISVAEACGLVWNCTDVVPGTEFAALRDCLAEPPSRQTYAAAAHALLRELKDRCEVNDGTDARLKRLYDRRDIIIDETAKLIAAGNGLDLMDPLQRGRAARAVDEALERWEMRESEDHPPEPTTPLEIKLQKIYRQCELIKDIEDAAEFGGAEEDESIAPLIEPKRSLPAALGTAPLPSGDRAADAIKGPPPAGSVDDQPLPDAGLLEIRAVLAEIKAQLPAILTSNALKIEITADITQTETETERPAPRPKFIKICLESLRDHLAKAAGAAGAAAVAAVGAILAKYFGLL